MKGRTMRFISRLLILAGVTAVTELPGAVAQATEQEPLVFLCDANYPPMTFQEGGEPKGVVVDIVHALDRRMGRSIVIRLLEWNEAQSLVAQGKADALCQMSITDDRKKIYDFSDPLLELSFSIFVNTGRVGIAGLSDLPGLRVGVTAGGLPRKLVDSDPQIKMTLIDDYLQGFQLLKEGKLDAVIADYWAGSYILAKREIRGIQAVDGPVARLKSSIAVRKGDTALLVAVNKALNSLHADGSIARINAKWQPEEIVIQTREQSQRKKYSVVIGFLVLVLTGVTLWMSIMRREISARKHVENEMKKLNDELEIRVAHRTEELKKLAEKLETQNTKLQEAYGKLEVETTERIRILEILREKELLLIQQSRMAAMGDMIGNIAHQWRQPLNVLGLKVQELGLSFKHGSFSEQLLNDNIAKAMEIVNQLSQTITLFQNFLKSDRGRTPFKVDQVIAKTVSLVEESYRNQKISIDIGSVGEQQINGYPNEYSQVLLNILSNARDAFLEHGVNNALITVCSWAENGKTVVTVTDNAGGIDEGFIDRVFDPYFTTKESGKGTGVGLFLSKMIIEKNMGGRLTVRNVEGGAQFRIEV